MKGGYIYILSNKTRTVLYVGITSNLFSRTYQHKSGSIFTSKYDCYELLYYHFFRCIEDAIAEEKRIKNWKREWKIDLIKKTNPQMEDLYESVRDLV